LSATDGVGLITDNGELTPPSQPSPLSQPFWVAPLKFDAVYMRFELAIRLSPSAPHAELQLYSTRATYMSVSTSVHNPSLSLSRPCSNLSNGDLDEIALQRESLMSQHSFGK